MEMGVTARGMPERYKSQHISDRFNVPPHLELASLAVRVRSRSTCFEQDAQCFPAFLAG